MTRPSAVLALWLSTSLHAAADDRRSGLGESCAKTSDCAGALVCVDQACTEPHQPGGTAALRAARQVAQVHAAVASYAAAHDQTLPRSLVSLVRGRFLRASQTVDPWGTELWLSRGRSRQADDFHVCSAGPDQQHRTGDDVCSTDVEE